MVAVGRSRTRAVVDEVVQHKRADDGIVDAKVFGVGRSFGLGRHGGACDRKSQTSDVGARQAKTPAAADVGYLFPSYRGWP